MDFEEFVLAASTGHLSEASAARPHADAVEFRIDMATDPVDELGTYSGPLPLVVTNRVEYEGGHAPDTTERLDTLETALEHPDVEAVDVELAAIEGGDGARVADHAREYGVSVIASAHDFDGTPDRETLDTLLRRACEVGDVGKVAVTAESVDDVLDLLAATRAATVDGLTVATMAMGEVGQHSRAVTPLYGSRIGYAPINPDDATAPGQFDLSMLADLLASLGVR